MASWFPPALFALMSFGLWGLFSKLAVGHIDSKSALIYQTIGVLIIGALTLSTMSFKVETDTKGLSYALLTGLTYGIGCLFYLLAASKGKIVTVVTMTALYPMVTILLAYLLLKEQVSLKQFIGIIFSVFAIILMSS